MTLTAGVDAFASPLSAELADDEPFVFGEAGSEAKLDETFPQRPSRKRQTPAIDRYADRLCVGFRWDFSTQFRFRIFCASRTRVIQLTDRRLPQNVMSDVDAARSVSVIGSDEPACSGVWLVEKDFGLRLAPESDGSKVEGGGCWEVLQAAGLYRS